MKQKKYVGIILFQVVIFIICCIFLCTRSYSPKSVINNMQPYGIEQQNNGSWYVDRDNGKPYRSVFLSSLDKSLEKGSYTVSVDYEADKNHFMEIFSGRDYLFSDGEIALGNGKHTQKMSFRVTQDIDDFEIRFYYSGKGSVKINEVSIVRNNGEEKENLLLAAIIIAFADLYFMLLKGRSQFVKLYPVVAGIVTGIALSVSGYVSEGGSFLGTLARECNGIGIDKIVVSIAVIYFYKKQWYLIHEIRSYVIRGISALFSLFMVIGASFASNGSLIFVMGNFRQFLVAALAFMGYYFLFRAIITFLFSRVSESNGIKISLPAKIKSFVAGGASAHLDLRLR